MAKKVWDIVRGAGLLTSIFSALAKAVEQVGGTEEHIHNLSTPEGEGVVSRLADIIVWGRSRISDEQIRFVQFLIWQSRDASDFTKQRLVFLWHMFTKNLTQQPVCLSVYGDEGVKFIKEVSEMTSSMKTTHICEVMMATGAHCVVYWLLGCFNSVGEFDHGVNGGTVWIVPCGSEHHPKNAWHMGFSERVFDIAEPSNLYS